MRSPIFKDIQPNYRKKAFEITLKEGRKSNSYILPFTVFEDHEIGTENRVTNIRIEKDLGSQGATIELEDGSHFDFPADLVLYHCDPSYDWGPINQLKTSLKDKLAAAQLSSRVVADALKTSPAQVFRLLEENKASKQLIQLFQLAELAGYKVEFRLKKKNQAS
ncbi:MAG: hypothetical protein H6626_02195 [Pseudobdellovibrionaceae bacterium]|nr:hypothetical protein [Bdellovibrionales bacterium]USN47923.1 MAG: hypothetical protein H6626_02195 [Pseudobdellovibrionaceae bacterium]